MNWTADPALLFQAVLVVVLMSMVAISLAVAVRNHWIKITRKPKWK